jgi:hypothetical protein
LSVGIERGHSRFRAAEWLQAQDIHVSVGIAHDAANLVAYEERFHPVVEWLGRKDGLLYYAFDLLYLDGFELRGAGLAERKRLLAALLADASERILYAEHLAVTHQGLARPILPRTVPAGRRLRDLRPPRPRTAN